MSSERQTNKNMSVVNLMQWQYLVRASNSSGIRVHIHTLLRVRVPCLQSLHRTRSFPGWMALQTALQNT